MASASRSPVPAPASVVRSRRHHHLAENLAVLNEAKALGRLLERKHLIDHRLDLVLLDQFHQGGEIVVIETVGALDLDLEAPDVAEVFLRIVARGRAANEQLAAAFN